MLAQPLPSIRIHFHPSFSTICTILSIEARKAALTTSLPTSLCSSNISLSTSSLGVPIYLGTLTILSIRPEPSHLEQTASFIGSCSVGLVTSSPFSSAREKSTSIILPVPMQQSHIVVPAVVFLYWNPSDNSRNNVRACIVVGALLSIIPQADLISLLTSHLITLYILSGRSKQSFFI